MHQTPLEELDSTLSTSATGQVEVLDSERTFYQNYSWCLNPYPTVGKTIEYLQGELDRLGKVPEGWQRTEVMTNVYLLSCAVLNAVDDYLRGKTFILPRKLRSLPFSSTFQWLSGNLRNLVRQRRLAQARLWREKFQPQLDEFLSHFLGSGQHEPPTGVENIGNNWASVLKLPLPAELLTEHTYFPSAFRKHDLCHCDILSLGRSFTRQFPDRQQPLLLIGLRTAGSYFAPILHVSLKAEGYQSVTALTIRPEKGLSTAEQAVLNRCARQKHLAVIVDDSPRSGDTIARAANLAHKAGFPAHMVVVLTPVHPASRNWKNHLESISLGDTLTLCLDAEEWTKTKLLEPEEVERRLAEYFLARGYSSISVVDSANAVEFNAELQSNGEEPRRFRLKRVYEVQLQNPEGQREIRYVLAKSVGWGWLGYHAFLAGFHLADFVSPILGLRDGILYSEWLPQASSPSEEEDREQWIQTAGSYIAARTRYLRMGENPLTRLALEWHHDSFRMLERVLSKAYGGTLIGGLMRTHIRHQLAGQPCPVPTLIDGKMHRFEWIRGARGLLKTDYEHHGMGKNELNVVDPAYDLAEITLHLMLSTEEENALVRRYQEESGDTGVQERIFPYQLLAGLWAMFTTQDYLFRRPQLLHRQQQFNQQFMDAWHFLTVQTARFCGKLCQPPTKPSWRSPLVVLDIDGVLDRRIFGFPSTTAAGIEALALLHAHDFALAVDTARSADEVIEYCQAYGFVGGVAEYGGYAWDAVHKQGRVLLKDTSLGQLEKLRTALEQIPGIYLDKRYRYSIRAYTYEDAERMLSSVPIPRLLKALWATGGKSKVQLPVPTLTVQHLLTKLGLDRLSFQQTSIDTTITAREADKGTGLRSLLDWVGQKNGEVIAVGDSEPDLPMFRVANRSFAPGHISCRRAAESVGCTVVRDHFQSGLLGIARLLTHADGTRCPRCVAASKAWPTKKDLFLELLQAADQKRSSTLLRALFHSKSYQIFFR